MQETQADCPLVLEYEPAKQLVHSPAPDPKLPAAQATQSVIGTMYTNPLPVLKPAEKVDGAAPSRTVLQEVYWVAAYAPAELVASYDPPPPPPHLVGDLGAPCPPLYPPPPPPAFHEPPPPPKPPALARYELPPHEPEGVGYCDRPPIGPVELTNADPPNVFAAYASPPL